VLSTHKQKEKDLLAKWDSIRAWKRERERDKGQYKIMS